MGFNQPLNLPTWICATAGWLVDSFPAFFVLAILYGGSFLATSNVVLTSLASNPGIQTGDYVSIAAMSFSAGGLLTLVLVFGAMLVGLLFMIPAVLSSYLGW